MAARKYASAESTGTSSTTSTSDQTKVTLTFTPDANSTYAYIWSCQALGDVNYDVRVKLKNNAGTAICSGNHQNNTTNDFIPYSGFAIETFGSSPTSQSITLTYSSEGTITASIKNARIVALKLTSADVYSENTGTSTTSSTSVFTAATTASFTPASAGYYAVLGYCEHNSGSNGGAGRYRVTINDSLSYNSAELVSLVTDYIPNMSVNYSTSLSGSCNIKYEFNSYGGNTVSCRNSKILALRMDEFDYSNVGINNSNNTTTTSTSYVTAETTGSLSLAKYDYMILGCSHYYTTSASIQGHFRWQTDGVTWAESDITNTTLGSGTGRAVSRHTGVYVRSSSVGNSTTNVQYRRDGSTTTGLYNTTLLYLALAPMVNNKARKYTLAESLTTSTTTSTTDQTKVTCTFTPDANSTYAYIWSCEIGNNSGTYDVRVKLKNNAGTEVCATNVEGSDTTDFIPLSGFDIEAFGASPTSQSVILTFSSENTALTSTIRNARVIAIKLSSSDQYVENTADTTTTSTSLQTATTLTFTPASAGDYLILGYCELRSSGGSVTINSQITHNSVAYSAAAHRFQDTTNYYANLLQASVGSLAASSQSITLQFSAGNVNTVNCRNSKLLALRLDQFGLSNITTDTTRTTTIGTAYSTKTSTGSVAMTNGLNYLIVGSATVDTSVASTLSGGFRFQNGGTAWAECLMEAPSVGFLPTRFSAFELHSGGTTTTTLDYRSETASVTTGADEVTISILQLDPDNLYWVGGSGTWDGSTTTNWSETSGGTGGAGAPKAGTNVSFDSASDSSAPFTVTINAGALANDLTASGLDQTMTWSGSGAMSVYGNFSVPATNFTQSYTGTITFAGTSTETITTNGKSFTAFTFDGVGGTWTLQDAATITGAATLTNGTLALGSYTFTCDNFASSNSNTRTINFGTGKIVISSASTATVWNTGTVTNLTVSGTPLVELTGGGATTKTVTLGALSESNSISVTLNTTAGTVALTGSARNLILANNSFTLSNAARTIYGNFTINGVSPTLTAGTGAMTLGATSGTKTITTNGVTLDFPITFDGAGGTFELGSDITIGTSTARTVTHTNGTIDLKGYNVTLYGYWYITQGSFAVTRQWNNTGGGSNKLILTIPASTATQVFNANDLTSFTTDGNINIQITGTGLYYMGRTSQSTVTNNFNVQVSSTSGTVVFGDATWGGSFRNLTIDNNSVTVTMFGAHFKGNYTVAGTNPTITNTSAIAWSWVNTSGTQTINLNGHNSNTIDWPITLNGAGSTLQLLHNLNVGVATSRTVTLTAGTLDLNEYNLTIYGVLSSTNANARTIDFGTASKIIFTLSSATTVVNTSTATNFSVLGDNPLFQLTGAGGTATFTFGAHTESGSVNVQLSSATTTAVTLTGSIRNLTIDNFDITLNNGTRTLYGNLTISGTTPVLAGGALVTTFAATSGIKTITTNGDVIDFPLTFSGVGGTWQLQDALSVGTSTVRTVTLTNGTLDLNGFTFTIFGQFSSSNSNARTIAFGTTGKIVLSATGATTTTLCTMTTETNLTVTGTNPLFQVTGSGVGPLTVTSTSSLINLQLSPVAAATIAVTGNIKDFIIDNSSNITLSNGARSIYGGLTIGGTSPTLTAGAAVTTFAATSGTHTITTNGEVIDFPITFNGVGGTWQLLSNMSVGTSTARAVTLTSGTIDLNEYNMTIFGSFESGGSNAKVIDFGSVSKILLTLTTTGSALSLQTATNLSYLGSNPLFEFSGGSGVGASITLSGSNAIQAAAPNLRINPASTVTTSVTHSFTNLTVENISGSTVNISTAARLYGNLVVAGTNPNFNSGTLTFSKPSGTQTVTTNGKAVEFRMAIDGTGTIVQLLDAYTGAPISDNVTLTNGTLDLNEYTMTIGQFSSNNSNVREIDFGTSGKLVLSGLTSAAAVVNCATVTNLTLTGNPNIEIAGSSGSSRQYLFGSTAGNSIESNTPDLTVTATGSGFIEVSSSKFRNLTYNTSDSATYINAGSSYCYGNLTSTNNGRIIGAGTITFAATSGTKTISLNAPAAGHQFNITINGIGGTFQAASNLNIIGSATSSGNFTLTNGTFEAGSYNITARIFDSNNSNVRTLNMGSGTWTFTGTGAIWNTTTTTNLTFIKGTANISSTHASTTLVEFRGGGLTYNNFTTTSTLNRVDIYGNNTFNTLTIAAGGALRFEAGSTNTFSTFSFGNNSGDNAALDTTTAGVAATLVYAGSSKVRTNYVTVRDITGSPVDTWYMGGNSTNTSNNTNLYFYNPPLYWIGGSGTWNNSSTTNWSYFSGGSSAGYYPDQYTDVIFDSNSDSGSSFAIVTSGTVACRKFTVSTLDQSMTLRVVGSAGTLSIYDNFSVPASNFSFTDAGAPGSSGSIVFSATSTGKTITTNGVSLLEVEFNGVGGGWTLQDNYTATVYTILTAGTITLNDNTLTTTSFTSSGSTARSVAFGTSGKIVLTGATGYPSNREWDVSTATNFTVSGSRRVEYTDTDAIYFFHGDVAGGGGAAVDLYITSANSGGLTAHTITQNVRTLDFTGSSTKLSTTSNLRLYGNLILSSSMSIDNDGGNLSISGTVDNQYITTNGVNLNYTLIQFDGTVQYILQDHLNCGLAPNDECRILLESGTIAMGNYDIIQYSASTSNAFSSNNSNVRGITSTGGIWKLTLKADTISSSVQWLMTTTTNMTNSSVVVELYGQIPSGYQRNISPGSSISESNAISFVIAFTGPGRFEITSGHRIKNLTFKDNNYNFQSTSFTVYGNLTFEGSSNIIFTGGTAVLILAGSGTQTITTNGVTIDRPITLSGTGSYSLGSALTIGSTRLLTYTSGNLVLNGYTLSTGTVEASGTSSRTINHGSNGQFTVVGSGASAFYANGSNITYAGRGMINMTSASAKTFTANGNIFATLNQGGLGTLTIRSSAFAAGPKSGTSFYSVKNTVSNNTVEFQRTDSFTFTNRFELTGSNTTHQLTIQSSAPTGGDPIGGGTYARLMCTNTTPQNIRYVKIDNYSTVAAPNNSVTPGTVSSSLYVRESAKVLIPSTSLFYNDDATTLAGNGSETSNGWNFVREQGFLSFF